jgi:hypothetical protein
VIKITHASDSPVIAGTIITMGTPKTLENDGSVEEFLNSISDETKINDSFVLLEIFTRITGEEPRMWGTSIVGFGKYHYKSERSSQEGDWMLTGFSPRKQNLTLYIMPGFDKYADLLASLGKHKTSVSCLYINKLSDVNREVLENLIKLSYHDMKQANT